MRNSALAIVLALIPAIGLAQSPGTLNLVGPSTTPGAAINSPASISAAINAVLAAKADVANPVFTGTITGQIGAFSGNFSVGGTVSGAGFTALLAPYATTASVTAALVPFAPLAAPTFTGTVTIPAGASIAGYAPLASPTFTGTVSGASAAFTGALTAISLQSTGTGTITAGSVGGNNGVRIVPSTTPQINAVGPAGAIGLNIQSQSGGQIGLVGPTLVSGLISQAFTIALASNTANNAASSGVFLNQTFTGTAAVTNGSVFNNITTSDNVTAPGLNGAVGWNFQHNFGGAATTNGRTALGITLNQTAATGDLADNFYVGATATAIGNFNNGGTGTTLTTAKGRLFGFNPTAHLKAGTNWFQTAGMEIDVSTDAGTSTAIRDGLVIAAPPPPTTQVQGSVIDAVTWIYGGQWQDGYLWGGPSQGWPINAGGSIMRAQIGNARPIITQAKWGVDFNQVAFPHTGNPYDGGFFRTRGASLDGAGTLQLGTAYLTPSSSGIAIDAKGAVGTAAAIASGGTGYGGGASGPDLAFDAFGGVYNLTSVAGVVTAVTVVTVPYYPSTTTPANPVATTAQAASGGTGLTLNLTWNTTANALSLQPSGGATTIGGTLAVTGATTLGTGTGIVGTATGSITVGTSNTNQLKLGNGSGNQIQAGGSNASILLQGTGTGGLIVNSGGGGGTVLSVPGSASAIANGLTIQGGTTGNPVTLTAAQIQVANPFGMVVTETWSGSASAPTNLMPFSSSSVIGGTSTSTTLGTQFNQFKVINSVVGQPFSPMNALFVDHETGAGMVGWAQGIRAQVNQQASSGNFAAGGNFNEVAGNFVAVASFNEGGTGAALNLSKGSVFAMNPDASLASGATFFQELAGLEINTTAATGSGVFVKYGIAITKKAADAVQGSGLVDAAITMTDQPNSTARWDYGLQFGNEGGSWSARGSLIGSRLASVAGSTTPGSVVWDADFLSNTATGGLLRGNGFQVDGTGLTRIGFGALKPVAGGLTIDTDGMQATTATVASGGSGYVNGSYVPDAAGNIWVVTAPSGVVTAATIYHAVQTTTATTPINLAVNPYLPAATGGQLNVAYASGNALSLQPTAGGKLAFNGATPIVKATPVGACAGNTGCQSLRDALGNLGLIATGSITN
jgi:hypothetical protein